MIILQCCVLKINKKKVKMIKYSFRTDDEYCFLESRSKYLYKNPNYLPLIKLSWFPREIILSWCAARCTLVNIHMKEKKTEDSLSCWVLGLSRIVSTGCYQRVELRTISTIRMLQASATCMMWEKKRKVGSRSRVANT